MEASLLNNIGVCHLEGKEHRLAIYYYNQSLKIRENLGEDRGVAQCYNNLGKAYSEIGDYEQSKYYLNNALSLGKNLGNTESILISLELLRNVYKKLGNYQQALENQEQYSHLRNSLFNAETVKKVSGVELKYALEKQKEVYEANAQKQESEKEKNRLAFYAAGGILLLLLALAALFLYLQKTKLKNAKLSNDKLELELKNLSLEKEKLTEDLDFQHREMASKVMYILKKNELIKSISDQLSTLKATTPPPNQKQLQEIIQEMNQKKIKMSGQNLKPILQKCILIFMQN